MNKLSKKKDSKLQKKLILYSITSLIIVLLMVLAKFCVEKDRLEKARHITENSPMRSIDGLKFWIETSHEKSFNGTMVGNGSALKEWYDISDFNYPKKITSSESAPIFHKVGDTVSCAKFNGKDNQFFKFDGSFLKNSDYTIMVVEQRESNDCNNFFIFSDNLENKKNINNNIILGYGSENRIVQSHNKIDGTKLTDQAYHASVTSMKSPNPKVLIFTHSAKNGNKIYVNGILAAKSDDKSHISQNADLSNVYIGKSYKGSICEVAIFDKELPENLIVRSPDRSKNQAIN